MAVFGRRKKATSEIDGAADVETVDQDVTVETDVDEVHDATEIDEAERKRRSRLRPRDEVDLSDGPFDAATAPKRDDMDFGPLRIMPLEDVELRLDVDEATQMLTGMTAVLGENGTSAVQLQVFAAPKTSGIWYGIRREIAEAIVDGGGTAEEVDGPLGTELHVRMPAQGPDGRTTFSPARFVGVDGPRWFLRAVFSGDAAVDEDAAERAIAFVRTLIVCRGGEARAPRELLELTLPPELMAQAQQQATNAEGAPEVGPLERGPEIAETR